MDHSSRKMVFLFTVLVATVSGMTQTVEDADDPFTIFVAQNRLPFVISILDISVLASSEGTFAVFSAACPHQYYNTHTGRQMGYCVPGHNFKDNDNYYVNIFLNGVKLPSVPYKTCLSLEQRYPVTTCSYDTSVVRTLRGMCRQQFCMRHSEERRLNNSLALAKFLPEPEIDPDAYFDLAVYVASNLRNLPRTEEVDALLEERSQIPDKYGEQWCIDLMYTHGWVESEDKILETVFYYKLEPEMFVGGPNLLVMSISDENHQVLGAGISKWIQPGLQIPKDIDDEYIGVVVDAVTHGRRDVPIASILAAHWTLLNKGIYTLNGYKSAAPIDEISDEVAALIFSFSSDTPIPPEEEEEGSDVTDGVHFVKTPAAQDWVPNSQIGEREGEWCTVVVRSLKDWIFNEHPTDTCVLYRVIISSTKMNTTSTPPPSPATEIAVVTVTTLDDFSHYVRSFLNQLCFSLQMTHTYYISVASPSLVTGQRSGYAIKFVVLLEAISRHKYALWVDRDSFFNMPQVFDEALDVRSYFADDETGVVLTGDGYTFNTGVFIVKDHAWARRLLETSYEDSEDGYFFHHPGDQAAISHAVLKLLAQQGEVKYRDECRCKTESCYGGSYSRLICFQQISRKNNIHNWLETKFKGVRVVGAWSSELNNTGVGCHTFEEKHCLHDVYKPAHIIHPGSNGPGGSYLSRVAEINICSEFLFGEVDAEVPTKIPAQKISVEKIDAKTHHEIENDGCWSRMPAENLDGAISGWFEIGSEPDYRSQNAITSNCQILNVSLSAQDSPRLLFVSLQFYTAVPLFDKYVLVYFDEEIIFDGVAAKDGGENIDENIYRIIFPIDTHGESAHILLTVQDHKGNLFAIGTFRFNFQRLFPTDAMPLSSLEVFTFLSEAASTRWLGRFNAAGLYSLRDVICVPAAQLESPPICIPSDLSQKLFLKIRERPSYANYAQLSTCPNILKLPLSHFESIFDYPTYTPSCPHNPDESTIVLGVVVGEGGEGGETNISKSLNTLLIFNEALNPMKHFLVATPSVLDSLSPPTRALPLLPAVDADTAKFRWKNLNQFPFFNNRIFLSALKILDEVSSKENSRVTTIVVVSSELYISEEIMSVIQDVSGDGGAAIVDPCNQIISVVLPLPTDQISGLRVLKLPNLKCGTGERDFQNSEGGPAPPAALQFSSANFSNAWVLRNDWETEVETSSANFMRFICRANVNTRRFDFPTASLPTLSDLSAYYVVMDSDFSYLPLWVNAAISLWRLGHRHFLPVYFDEISRVFFRRINLTPIDTTGVVENARAFLSGDKCDSFLKEPMIIRTAVVAALAKKKLNFLFTDSDTFHLRDFTASLRRNESDIGIHMDVGEQVPFQFKWRFWKDSPKISAAINNGVFAMRGSDRTKFLFEDWYQDSLSLSMCSSGFLQTSLNSFLYHKNISPVLDTSEGPDQGLEYTSVVDSVAFRFYTQQQDLDGPTPPSTYFFHAFGHSQSAFQSQGEMKAARLKSNGFWFLREDWLEISNSKEWESFGDFLEAVTLTEPIKFISLNVLSEPPQLHILFKLGQNVQFDEDDELVGKMGEEILLRAKSQDEGHFFIPNPAEPSSFFMALIGKDGSIKAQSDTIPLIPKTE